MDIENRFYKGVRQIQKIVNDFLELDQQLFRCSYPVIQIVSPCIESAWNENMKIEIMGNECRCVL